MIYSNSNYVVRHSCVAIIDLQVKAIIVCKYFVSRKKKNHRKNISYSIWIMNSHCNQSCRLKDDLLMETNQLGDKIFWRPGGDISSVVVILCEDPLKLRMSCWPVPGLKCLHL